VRVVAAGEALLAPSVTRRLLDAVVDSLPSFDRAEARALNALTPSERKVLACVGRGLSNEEIAAELFIADTTVRTHIRHILDKLQLRDRVHAVIAAYDAGLVRPVPR
jgi:DNA-binding NarL/FixJ family response regulator